jgi:ABC-type nitrate/sulfonate/bicarbonate transport system permease component
MASPAIETTRTIGDAGALAEEQADRVRAANAAERKRRARRWTKIGVRLSSLIAFLLFWEIGGGQLDQSLFATPSRISVAAVQMIASGELWHFLAPSLLVMLYGFSIATVVGILLGLLLARYWVLDTATGFYITFLYSTPMVALIPLIVIWAGFDTAAKTIILFLFAFFPIVINTYQGVKNVSPELIEVGRAFRCSESELWRHVVLPAALPFVVTGLRLALGRGLIGMVTADLYTAISGIGYLIVRTASTYQMDKMFVPIVTLGLLGVFLAWLLRLLEIWVAPWTRNETRD